MTIKQLSNDDYERLKSFFICYVDWFVPEQHKSKNPEDHPLNFLGNLEKKSMPNAKKGLQMAINDVVEMTSDWRPQQVAEADERLSKHGTFTLSEVRCRYSKKYKQILNRGVIRNEVEYYLVKGIADCGQNEDITEKLKIEAMLCSFEEKLSPIAP